jgi:protein SCO1/2
VSRAALGFAAAAALAVLVAGIAAARFWLAAPGAPLPEIGGYVLAEPRALPDVALVDSDGSPFGAREFAGHWSFLYFGYTYCPDVCPLSLVELASLKELLAAQAPGAPAEYYLVSVDPKRDTPERLREYVTYFDPAFRGLTGEPDALAQLAASVGAIFFVPPGQDEQTYVVSHTSNVTLLDPDGQLHAVFTTPHTPTQLAADFAKVLDRWRTLGR